MARRAWIGDHDWMTEAVHRLRQRDPDNQWPGLGLVMLQGAFKKAGLITKPVLHDRIRLEVKTWKVG